jgi:hypothetical protein
MTWAAYGPPWAAYGPQNQSDDGIRWHDMSENVNQPTRVPAGQSPVGAAHKRRANDRTLVTCGYGCSAEGCSRVKRADLPAFWVVWGSSGWGRGRGGCGAVLGCRG